MSTVGHCLITESTPWTINSDQIQKMSAVVPLLTFSGFGRNTFQMWDVTKIKKSKLDNFLFQLSSYDNLFDFKSSRAVSSLWMYWQFAIFDFSLIRRLVFRVWVLILSFEFEFSVEFNIFTEMTQLFYKTRAWCLCCRGSGRVKRWLGVGLLYPPLVAFCGFGQNLKDS